MDRRKFIGITSSSFLPWIAGCAGSSTEQDGDTTKTNKRTTTTEMQKTVTSARTTKEATTVSDTKETTTTSDIIAAPESVPSYTVVQAQDVSYAGVIRIAVEVKAAKNVTELTKQEYLQIAQDVVHQVTVETEVNAVHVGFWKQDAVVGQDSNFAYVEWAPHGEWDQAGSVDTGDYSSHEYQINAPAVFELVKFSLPNSVEMGQKVQPKATVKNHGLEDGAFRGIVEVKQSYSWASISVFEEEIPAKEAKTWRTEPILFDFVPPEGKMEFRLRASQMVKVKGGDPLTDSMKVTPLKLVIGDSFTTSSQEKITVRNLRLKSKYSYESYDGSTEKENAPDGKQFAFIDVITENIGDYASYGPSAMYFTLLSNGRSYENAYLTFKETGKLEGEEIQPGKKEKGWVAFKIPEHLNTQDITILYNSAYVGEKNVDGDVKVKWIAG